MAHLARQSLTASRPDDLAPWAELAQRATQCGRLLRARIVTSANGDGMGETEFLLLWACYRVEPTGKPQIELADELGVSPAQVSGLVDRLQRQGLIAGERDPLDRRRQRWRATAAGEAKIAQVVDQLTPWLATIASQMSGEHAAALADELRRLHAALSIPAAEPPDLRVIAPPATAEEARS